MQSTAPVPVSDPTTEGDLLRVGFLPVGNLDLFHYQIGASEEPLVCDARDGVLSRQCANRDGMVEILFDPACLTDERLIEDAVVALRREFPRAPAV